jgi:hypothetical protein
MFCGLLFDEPRLIGEFESLPSRIKKILWYSAALSSDEFNTPLVLTHILRTQEEQNEIYGNNQKYKLNPWKSPHQELRAADARLRDMGVKNANRLAEEINRIFPYDQVTGIKTVLVHDVGHGNHIHFQIPRE